jgi:DNA-binding MarR family transcriptional regulator
MKNKIGQIVRGDDFFPRDLIIKKIYRGLDSEGHLFLSAPRRVGKSSLMLRLVDEPKKNYHFIYTTTQSIDTQEAFFQKLLDDLLDSDVIKKIIQLSEKSKNAIAQVLERVKSVKLGGLGLEFNDGAASTFQQEFENLLEKLETKENRIVLLIDEFPWTLENIRKNQGEEAALKFLQVCRTHRQNPNSKIQFVLTGSIGLPVIVRSMGKMDLINDLNVIEVPPLDESEALLMATVLLNTYRVKYNKAAISHLLKRIHWLIPFHIQLAVQEIIDLYELKKKEISNIEVDEAFERVAHYRNDTYFDSFHSRISERFQGNEYKFVIQLLNYLSNHDDISTQNLQELTLEFGIGMNLNAILDSLVYDGYINNHISPNYYRFNSSILKLWWSKYRAS